MTAQLTHTDPVVAAEEALKEAQAAERALVARLEAGEDVPTAEFTRARELVDLATARKAAAPHVHARRRRRELEAALPALKERLARLNPQRLERLQQRVHVALGDLNRGITEWNREVAEVRDALHAFRDVTTDQDHIWTSGELLGGGAQLGNGEAGTVAACLYPLATLLGGFMPFAPVVIPEPEPAPGHIHEFHPVINGFTKRITGWTCRTCEATEPADRFPPPPSEGWSIHRVAAD